MGSSPLNATGADSTRPSARVAGAALAVALAAFALYHATLLPGFDFGDTGTFQTVVGSPIITTRDAYPLYFAIGGAVLWLTGGDPARTLNLLSAIEAAVACGLFVLVAVELTGSLAVSVSTALLFAVSYTFWSQAIIAEVYALHLAFVLLTMLLLLRWERRPTVGRLALFFAIYALGFGNHLSMVLLLPAFAVFILTSAPGGWRSVVTPRIVLLAVGIAALGSLQYVWNLRWLWITTTPPASIWSALGQFWFDVTKSDWRETLVLRVPESMLRDHAAMYGFDLQQQFSLLVLALAPIGFVALIRQHWRRGLLLALSYLVAVGFAFSYNVGDAHVFYLPSHLALALAIAAGAAAVGRSFGGAAMVPIITMVALVVVTRGYRDFPAQDRSADRRPAAVLEPLTRGLDDQHAIFLVDLNWQIANGLSYYTKRVRPEVAVARMPDVLAYAPALVADNQAAGRRVALTSRARSEIDAAFGPLLPTQPDDAESIESLTSIVRSLPAGTRYVLCVLKPSRDLRLDEEDLAAALRQLTNGRVGFAFEGDYAATAGTVGAPPTLHVADDRPFERSVIVDGVPVDIRMESWLASDTIRRMGFGHVVAAREHTLIVERGVSFAAFDAKGRAIRTAYAANLFEPQRRFVVQTP